MKMLLIAALLAALVPRTGAAQVETLTAPTFGRISVYAPSGAPDAVVLFISGDGGWNLGVVAMAERLRDLGALVVGIDIRSFLRGLAASGGDCTYPAGDLEELSRHVQLHRKLASYKRPILVGYSSGATLVYAALASAPAETFAGAISLGFCPDILIRPPLCEMRGLKTKKRSDRLANSVQPGQPAIIDAPAPTKGIRRPSRAASFRPASGSVGELSSTGVRQAGQMYDPAQGAAMVLVACRRHWRYRWEEGRHLMVP